ncbi:MAG: hypothetical protein IPO63_14070 [Bacteroidetes bacterium]|nr:hypothetical protein [Bacteroidota bacterium]
MYKTFLLLFIVFHAAFSTFAQQERKQIDNVSNFEVDPLGNCYYLKNDELVKVNNAGKELVRYSMKNLGAPSAIDVNNPLRILVFYSAQAVIRILDNNLVDQSELDLRSMGIIQPKVMAGTPDQGIWIFDEISASLIKIDTRLKSSALSVDLTQLTGRRPNPLRLIANQNWVVMHDQQGIIIFDQFGTKLKSIPLDTPSIVLQLSENSLIYSDKGQLMSYQMNLNAFQKENNLCPKNAVKAYFSEEKCWFLDQETLYFPQ